MTTTKNRMPRLSAFAQMLREKREKLAPEVPLKEFCAARGLEVPLISDMESDRRTAPGTYAALYKLASGYGHGPDDRWTKKLLDAAVGKAPEPPRRAALAVTPGRTILKRAAVDAARKTTRGGPGARSPRRSRPG
jgi:hypothetical protein